MILVLVIGFAFEHIALCKNTTSQMMCQIGVMPMGYICQRTETARDRKS